MKNYKVTPNRNVKANKKVRYKSQKYIEICIYTYIYIILRNSKKLCSNAFIAFIEHFARDFGTAKWHPYNVVAKVISFLK